MAVGDDAVVNNAMSHVRIIAGVTGDGSADGTRVIIADSKDGQIRPMQFKDFARLHGGADPVNLGLGIFHF